MLLLRKAEISPVPVASKVADAYYQISQRVWPCDLLIFFNFNIIKEGGMLPQFQG